VVRTATQRDYIDIFRGRRFRRDIPGQGSGVIISKDGYVLTSNHVIAGVEAVAVELYGGLVIPAEIVGRDPITDLAVLRMITKEPREFTPIEFGDSAALRVGEFVIAAGAPFSLTQELQSSVTLGIVSQKERSIGLLPYEDFIQTDAPINPGNSGGPLLDVDGRMVGINTLIQKGGRYSEGNIGIGFAVPGNLAKRVSDSIIRTGHVEHPWIGISMLPTEDGVYIQEVIKSSPAWKAGLRMGDLIRKIDGKKVQDWRSVKRGIFRNDVGDAIRLQIQREDTIRDFDVTLEAMPNIRVIRR